MPKFCGLLSLVFSLSFTVPSIESIPDATLNTPLSKTYASSTSEEERKLLSGNNAFLVVWFLMCLKLFHISLRGLGGIQNRRQVRQFMINENYLMNISTSFVYTYVFPVAELIILGNNIESDT